MRVSAFLKELNLVCNVLIITGLYIIGYWLRFDGVALQNSIPYLEFLIVLNIAWVLSAIINRIHTFNRVTFFEIVIKKFAKAILLYLLLILSYVAVSQNEISSLFAVKAYLAAALGLTIFHFTFIVFLKYWRRMGHNYKRIVIVGYGELAEELRNFFVYHPEHGYRFMGFFDDHTNGENVLGSIQEIEDYALRENIDEIYLCTADLDYAKMPPLIKFADNNFIKLKVIPDFRGFPYKSLDIQLYDYIPVLKLGLLPLDHRFNQFLKRAFDIAFSGLFLLLIYSWLYPVIALLIKLDSKGPVYFKQARTGENSKAFSCYKFRTMKVNKDADTKQATKNDPRITRIGRFLRKTSLDELPQFINVLKGDMSVIGPRPHPLKLNADFSPVIEKFMMRHAVKPGITGLAQAKGFRGETSTLKSMQDRVRLDRFYVENWSFFLDIKIIFLTIKSLLVNNENAY